MNFPAHLVVVKGTEYYDGKSRRYVDYPITGTHSFLFFKFSFYDILKQENLLRNYVLSFKNYLFFVKHIGIAPDFAIMTLVLSFIAFI